MSAVEAQIASVSIVCWPVGSGTDQRKNQSVASLAFVRRIHRWPMNSPHKGPVTRKMFSFNDVIMLFLSSGQLCNAFTPQLFLNYLPFKSGGKVYWSYQFSFIRHLWGPFFMYIPDSLFRFQMHAIPSFFTLYFFYAEHDRVALNSVIHMVYGVSALIKRLTQLEFGLIGWFASTSFATLLQCFFSVNDGK